VVVPVYKEEGNIDPFLQRIEPVMERLGVRYEILFCLDPSPDRTEQGF
jgi:glycosyltransferase involved in cell wall biosynthesis